MGIPIYSFEELKEAIENILYITMKSVSKRN